MIIQGNKLIYEFTRKERKIKIDMHTKKFRKDIKQILSNFSGSKYKWEI